MDWGAEGFNLISILSFSCRQAVIFAAHGTQGSPHCQDLTQDMTGVLQLLTPQAGTFPVIITVHEVHGHVFNDESGGRCLHKKESNMFMWLSSASERGSSLLMQL